MSPGHGIAVALAGAMLIAPAARAQSLDDLKKQIELMQKMQQAQQKRIDQLESALRENVRRTAPEPKQRTAAAPRAPQAPLAPAQPATAQESAVQAKQAAAEAKQAAAEAQRTAAVTKEASAQAVQEAFTPPPGLPAGTFRIPNTGVSLRIYGQVKTNGSWDLSTFNRADATTAQAIPLSGSANARIGGDFQASARRSRIGVETWAPTDTIVGDVHALVEMDFAGQNTDFTTQSTANSYTPRLRRAFFDFGQAEGWGTVLVGQENSVFNDAAILPFQWLADWTPGAMSGVRQAQARYTYGFGNGLSTSVAMENAYSDITTTSGTSFQDNNGGGGVGFSQTPDFTARLLWRQDWGLIALRGVVRPDIALNNQGAALAADRFNKSVTGWGIGATGAVNLFDRKLVLMGTANYGDGLGRYLDATSNGFSAVSNVGLPGVQPGDPRLSTVRVAAGLLGMQINYTESLRTNVSVFGARLDYPSYVGQFGGCYGAAIGFGTCNLLNRAFWGGSVNLIWSPVRQIDIGIEYQHIQRALQTINGTSNSGGVANRIQISGVARF